MAEIAPKFSKTKILATLGPATGDVATIRQLIGAGIAAVRLNMSHGSGEIAEPGIVLQTGNLLEITTNDIIGTEKIISTSYGSLVQDAEIGDRILINDGLIQLTIIEKKADAVICRIDAGGMVTSKKGMNLPGMNLSTPSITAKDFRLAPYRS